MSYFRAAAFALRNTISDTYTMLNAADVVDEFVQAEVAKALDTEGVVSIDTIARNSLAIEGFFANNKKIYAIKELRALTGCSLRAAKDSIERVYDFSVYRTVPQSDTDDALAALRQKLTGN